MTEDTRPRADLNGKTINLEQLAQEVGTPLCASDVEVVVADEQAPVTVQQLEAAVDAHVPVLPEPFEIVPALEAATTLVQVKAALITHFQEGL